MVQFACDDKETEKVLKRLCKQVTENGGLIYDGLTIGTDNGALKITVDEQKKTGEKILVLPKKALLPVSKFKFGLKRSDIVIESHDDDLSQGQVDMMETMIALYNLTDKIKQQKETVTLGTYYTDKDLFDVIIKARGDGGVPFLERMLVTDEKDFYLDSFIKTRVLGYKETDDPNESEVDENGKKIKQVKPLQVIMPIIDFLNHHPNAPGFFIGGDAGKMPDEDEELYNPAEQGVSVAKACPVEDSNECYVSYGIFDAYDTFLHYNYVETGATIVRSVPMELEMPGIGTLKIEGYTGRVNFKKLPEKMKDLKFYIPAVTASKKDNKITLSHLFIPGNRAPRALRRVLSAAVNQLRPQVSEQEFKDAIFEVERQIIIRNLSYYKELSDFMASYKPSAKTKIIAANAKQAAQTQIGKIQDYPFFERIDIDEPKKKAKKARA